MTYPTPHAATYPDKRAVIIAETGQTLTYGELDEGSRRLARLLHEAGLRAGDHVSVMAGSHRQFLVTYWAAMRSGLYFTPINTFLTSAEAAFVLENSGAKALIIDGRLTELAADLVGSGEGIAVRLSLGGELPGYRDFDEAIAECSADLLDEELLGRAMLYSSGSTGRPKAIKRPLSGWTVQQGNEPALKFVRDAYSVNANTICLSPAPLYHAAPLSFCSAVTALGGTVVLMEKFDAASALQAIADYRATHTLLVPTMFIRLLRLDDETRAGADLSSLEFAMHGASPCPVSVKRAIIDWWGPIIYEYYAGSEDNGSTLITSAEWLERPGSVGRAFTGSTIHICDSDGIEQPTGVDGIVYFETVGGQPEFEYHGEPEKTADTRHPLQPSWTTLGDIGHVDEEGYLFLTDRTDYMIISGGVNISPQEIEDTIIEHPAVLDVAVFGVPNPEFGEEVKAVIQLADPTLSADEIASEVREFVRERLARHKVPRSVDIIEVMPRSPAGKLYKKQLRASYLEEGY